MKNALKRLQGRARERWRLLQARAAIASCNRALAHRCRIGATIQRPPRAPYFAPGIIDAPQQQSRRSARPYLVTLLLAVVASLALVFGGVPT